MSGVVHVFTSILLLDLLTTATSIIPSSGIFFKGGQERTAEPLAQISSVKFSSYGRDTIMWQSSARFTFRAAVFIAALVCTQAQVQVQDCDQKYPYPFSSACAQEALDRDVPFETVRIFNAVSLSTTFSSDQSWLFFVMQCYLLISCWCWCGVLVLVLVQCPYGGTYLFADKTLLYIHAIVYLGNCLCLCQGTCSPPSFSLSLCLCACACVCRFSSACLPACRRVCVCVCVLGRYTIAAPC